MSKNEKAKKYNDYLDYTIPQSWCAEENEDGLLLYDPDGEGAITISFFSRFENETPLVQQISTMAVKFFDQNNIQLHSNFIVHVKKDKTVLQGVGQASDGWYCQLWIVAKHPKIVFATYFSEKKTKEVAICDSIIDSFRISF